MDGTSKAKADLSAGLLKMLQPVVEECDLRANMVLDSQDKLSLQIDIFSSELAKIMDIKNPNLSQYADKLNASKKKLKRVDTLVMQTKERVANIARMHQALLDFEHRFIEREVLAPKEAAAAADANSTEPTPAAPAEDKTESETKEEAKEDAPAEAT